MIISKMPPEEARSFAMKAMELRKMGYVGLSLLILSGLYLMSPYWRILPDTPLLIAKLLLVVVLVGLISVMSKAGDKFRAGDFSQMKLIRPLGRIALIVTILIVILAVGVFH
ncbi:MAG: hypothetical protein IPP71_10495 [Bacteroidetes bacterium]|nr:hypothetical protein [Bacteroidota bacterium]